MTEYVKEIIRDYKLHLGEEASIFPTPGYNKDPPKKNKGLSVSNKQYWSLIGKIMFAVRKCIPDCMNALRELLSFLDNDGEDHWR
jgi:hypothetical protein